MPIAEQGPGAKLARSLTFRLSQEEEEGIGMSIARWRLIQKHLQDCKHKIDSWEVGWSFSSGAFMTSAPPGAMQIYRNIVRGPTSPEPGFIWIVVFAVTAVALVLTLLGYLSTSRSQNTSIQSVIDEMQAVEKEFLTSQAQAEAERASLDGQGPGRSVAQRANGGEGP